ncbi:hypothetical protein HAX54_030819 [Datura stramonium]|uniref:NB-ARC domain-containing protein n=1 Tax=Datura stramonium TaxID=4076 RepID=A0ABS8V865_DATST|nr:hypothetical protein [Datura stramonium]
MSSYEYLSSQTCDPISQLQKLFREWDSLGFSPCIRKIYIDVLQALKSEQSGWHPNIQIELIAHCEAGFVETLIHSLEELPTVRKHKVSVALEDQKAILQEMLNFLRANLINLLKEALEDFDTIIIDVGFSLLVVRQHGGKGRYSCGGVCIQVPVLDFSGNIQSLQSIICLITRKSFHSNLPTIDGMGSINIILDHLKEFLNRYSDSLVSIVSQLQAIQQQLEHFQKHHNEFQYFAMQASLSGALFAGSGDIIEEDKLYGFYHRTGPGPSIVLKLELLLRSMLSNETMAAFFVEKKKLLVKAAAMHRHDRCARRSPTHTKALSTVKQSNKEITQLMMEVANIDENKVADLNCGENTKAASNWRIAAGFIPLLEWPDWVRQLWLTNYFLTGLVVSHFDVRAQCCVSQVYTRKDLLLTILRDVKKDAVISDKLPENELADKLRKLLLVKRYLILIDDVWETIAWDDLKPCFYDANNRSRIILTTQLGDVASHAKLISDPYLRRLFTPDESWMLLMNKVFHKKSCPPALEDVGKR